MKNAKVNKFGSVAVCFECWREFRAIQPVQLFRPPGLYVIYMSQTILFPSDLLIHAARTTNNRCSSHLFAMRIMHFECNESNQINGCLSSLYAFAFAFSVLFLSVISISHAGLGPLNYVSLPTCHIGIRIQTIYRFPCVDVQAKKNHLADVKKLYKLQQTPQIKRDNQMCE